jgi:hypothetical protein
MSEESFARFSVRRRARLKYSNAAYSSVRPSLSRTSAIGDRHLLDLLLFHYFLLFILVLLAKTPATLRRRGGRRVGCGIVAARGAKSHVRTLSTFPKL